MRMDRSTASLDQPVQVHIESCYPQFFRQFEMPSSIRVKLYEKDTRVVRGDFNAWFVEGAAPFCVRSCQGRTRVRGLRSGGHAGGATRRLVRQASSVVAGQQDYCKSYVRVLLELLDDGLAPVRPFMQDRHRQPQ